MLLDIVVIVLRETLEASVLIGVLLSLSQRAALDYWWLALALLGGALGAWAYGANLGAISDWFDYTGQELVNAVLQYCIYLQLLAVAVLQYFPGRGPRRCLQVLLVTAVTSAVIREGSELFVFYFGFMQGGGEFASALTSGFIGLAIGLSAGAIAYFFCVSRRASSARLVHAFLLALIGAGMAMQATGLLIQADWISAGRILWDSNWLLDETSIFGQLAYAVFGYEARPSATELGIYCLAVLAMGAAMFATWRWSRHAPAAAP